MSAFIVSQAHIRALIDFAVAKDIKIGGVKVREDPGKFGQLLLHQNYLSCDFRCNEKSPVALYIHGTFERHRRSALEILKACECYDYQACETPNYKDTKLQRHRSGEIG